MEIKEAVETMLENVGIPYRYRIFKGDEIPSPPFAVYWIGREQLSGADDLICIKEATVTIRLITSDKDFAVEEKIEAELSEVGQITSDISKDEDYVESEEAYVITYEFTLTTKIRR